MCISRGQAESSKVQEQGEMKKENVGTKDTLSEINEANKNLLKPN
jgi:hypothetical protein